MSDYLSKPCTAFSGTKQFAAGSLVDVALAIKAAEGEGREAPVLVFDDASGSVMDLDLRGTTADIVVRLGERGSVRHRREGRERLRTPMRSLVGVDDRNWASLPGRSRCFPDTGNGSPRSPAGPHRPCGVLLTRLAVPMEARPKPKLHEKPPIAF